MAETLQFDLDPEEVEVFCLEAQELIQQMDCDLLQLEQTGNDPVVVQRLFRVAHNLKGSAGTIAHTRMAGLTHSMETVLDLLRQQRLSVSPALVDVLLASSDALKLLNQEVSTQTSSGVDPAGLIGKLQVFSAAGAGDGRAPAAALPAQAPVAPANGHGPELRVAVQIDRHSIAPAARALQVILTLEECGTVVWSRPARAAIERGETLQDLEVLLNADRDPAQIRRYLERVGEISDIEIGAEVEAPGQAPAAVAPVGNAAEPAPGKSAAPVSIAGDISIKTVRTSVERLDKLMNLVGELVTDRNRLLQAQTLLRAHYQETDTLGELAQAISHLASITDELQEEIMRARMLPLERVFNKFPRMVRDLAHEVGKSVDLVIEGQETELDRSVIEQIADPLLHLLRNAIDHGIESPEERRAAGKRETGTIRLAGRSEGNHIIITVSDDGRGIDVARVRSAAVARGLLSEEAAARLSEAEAIDLIFSPGLSTARRVTDISGRGVGMDVVQHQIQRLHGTVAVSTRAGQGSSFQLTLPLTLAIMPVLLVVLRDITFCIPLTAVTEVIQVQASSVHQVDRGEIVLWRKRLLPLVRLSRFFRLAGAADNHAERFSVVAVQFGEEHAGLVVDGLLGQQEIVIKNLGHLVGQVPGITGATILGDGSVALIIDVPGLIKQAARG